MKNNTLIARAAIDTSSLNDGGRMNPEQQKKFITFMQDHSVFLKRIGVINMQSTKRHIDTLGVNRHAMRAQQEDQPHVATGRINAKRRLLSAVGVMMPYNVSFQYVKENIEGENIHNTLADLFAKQFANESVDLAFNGDESSSHPVYSINDGYLKIAVEDPGTHKVDNLGDLSNPMKIFDALLSAIPNEYYQLYQEEDKNLIKLMVSPILNHKYKRQLEDRGTNLGDSMIVHGKNVTYDGHEVIPIGFMPDNFQLACPYENMKFGIYGNSLEVYHEVKPRLTRHEYTLLGDFDMEFENPDVVAVGGDLS